MLAPRDDDSATDANPGDDERPYYRGYLVDLLEALARHASFTYTLRAVPDRQRGARRQDGTWSGLVGELIAGVSAAPCPGRSSMILRPHHSATLPLSSNRHNRSNGDWKIRGKIIRSVLCNIVCNIVHSAMHTHI